MKIITNIKGKSVISKQVAKADTEQTEINNPDNDLLLDFDDFDFAEDVKPTNLPTNLANKTPKNELILFLQQSAIDTPYLLQYNGNFEGAKSHIHRMRVELSRFRAQIIKLNKKLDHFHVLVKDITIESETLCTITLLKTYERKKNKKPEVLNILDLLTVNESGNKES